MYRSILEVRDMNLDIVEIGLNFMTDGIAFEKLASEVMREEGYHDIRPLGGVDDQGQDAFQDRFYEREGRTRTVFQYTLEDYVEGKLRDTVTKLEKNDIEYATLVIVTPIQLSSDRQSKLKKLAREDYDIALDIYERRTLVNRLSDFSNGIFHRHFPSIEHQMEALTSSQPVFADVDGKLRTAMLKVSIAFVLGEGADAVRKSVFDRLVLASLVAAETGGLEPSAISKRLAERIGCEPFQEHQILAALHRLETLGFVNEAKDETGFCLTDQALNAVEGATIEANALTTSLISDLVEEVCGISGVRVSRQERSRLERNAKDVLAEMFRLMGLELANRFLEEGIPTPLYLDASSRILGLAKHQISEPLGELLVAALANVIQQPDAEQSQILASWARAYVGACVMNLDPVLREFQETRLRGKTFILDTDFVLRCVIREHPRHAAYLVLVQRLSALGCRLIIPQAVIDECIIHAMLAAPNYNYFGSSLMGMTTEFVHRKVNNIFVQGYYYGRNGLLLPAKWTFRDYLSNYYEPDSPHRFFSGVIAEKLPSTIQTMDPAVLLAEEPPESLVEAVKAELLRLLKSSPKSEHRTSEQTEQLAYTDARLFVTALQLNSDQAGQDTRRILGGACYVITNSSRYLRAARTLNIRDVVSTRPQQLVTLLELIAGPIVDDVSFVRLFENPLLNYAVEAVWDDVRVLLSNGIGLTGRSLARLRWDLDEALHERISALKRADEKAEAAGEDAPMDAGDQEYVELFRKAAFLGYPYHPSLESLRTALMEAKNEAELERASRQELQERFDLLATEIERFGKKKQRYFKHILRGQGDRRD
jgi:hypothetical protein